MKENLFTDAEISEIKESLSKQSAFIFTGQSGSGKETQSVNLKEFIEKHKPYGRKVLRIVTGDLFREWIKDGKETYTKRRVKEINDAGGIQSPLLATRLWLNELVDKFSGEEHLIIDGSPRTPQEAVLIANAFSSQLYDISKPTVVILNISDKTAMERLVKRNESLARAETGSLEIIQNKLSWYHKDVVPAIRFIKNQGDFRVVEVDGEADEETVFKEMVLKVLL